MNKNIIFKDNFDQKVMNEWMQIGRLKHSVDDGILSVSNGYVVTGSNNWSDYSLEFTARTPENVKVVQIWAGFRHHSRDYRYVVALRGGNNNHMYLARYGAEGHDKFLDIAPLDFTPSVGTWYTLKVVVVNNKIAVYLNDEKKPRLLASDMNSPFTTGGITLGGSYLKTEFESVIVTEVNKDILDEVVRYELAPPILNKEAHRKEQLASYKAINIGKLKNDRMEVSLNGNWLFMPDNEKIKNPNSEVVIHNDWHIIDVPNFWVPTRAWLEGERFEDGKFNKGQNDVFHQEEQKRCQSYTFDYEETESAWYRHTLNLPKDVVEKKLVLHFEGVSLISEVYINGEKIHENKGMFGPFDIDITDYVSPGDNRVLLYVNRLKTGKSVATGDLSVDAIEDNYSAAWDIIGSGGASGKKLEILDDMELPRGFYQGSPGGIWKPVTLIISNKLKVEECFFVPSLTSASIEVWYSNKEVDSQLVELHYQIINKETSEPLCDGVVEEYSLNSNETRKVHFKTKTIRPKLWAPGEPNLYILKLSLLKDGNVLDTLTETVGFKTVGTDGNKVIINGKPTWIRGANHLPGHIKPNDSKLAYKFMKFAIDHNVMATRTHCAPFSKAWMKAADEIGVMVSYEGTWPWLMLRGKDTPPRVAIDIWLDDMRRLFRANRNHPSIFMWTMNNEMKFLIYGTGKSLKVKGSVLNDAMKVVRDLDSSRPIVADSSYFKKVSYLVPRLQLLFNKIDDGEIDDPHIYNSWYENSFYHLAHGEFSKLHALPNRPLITQEASTGYPRSQDGLPTRSYLFDHQTPQTWVGNDAYEHSDPSYFQQRHAMLTKGTFETLRRVDYEKISGVMPFAFETWFYNHHDVNKVRPMQTVKSLEMIFQPVLASLDLQVLNYYEGASIDTEVFLLNDDTKRDILHKPNVKCDVVYKDDVLVSKTIKFEDVTYYKKDSNQLRLTLPSDIELPKIYAQLRLSVITDGEIISVNSYNIVIAKKSWALQKPNTSKTYAYCRNDRDIENLLKFVGLEAKKVSLSNLNQSIDTLILGKKTKFTSSNINKIKSFTNSGGNVILLHPGKNARKVFPTIILNYVKEFHEIVTMNIKESMVFNHIEPLELSWFPYKPYEKRKAGLVDAYVPPYSGFLKELHKFLYTPKVPHVATGRYSVDRMNSDVVVLAQTLQPHGYLSNPDEYKKLGGTPLFDVKIGMGTIRFSEIRYDAIEIDPINARFMLNILL